MFKISIFYMLICSFNYILTARNTLNKVLSLLDNGNKEIPFF